MVNQVALGKVVGALLKRQKSAKALEDKEKKKAEENNQDTQNPWEDCSCCW